MNYEHSAGAVVYTMVEGVPHFALVVEKNGDCGLPKGHIEGNETEKETALREIWEEIGVRVEIVSAFKKTVQYPLRNGRMKKVTYFLAEYQDQAIRVDTGEVGDAYLLPFAQALSALKYPKSKEVLASAYEYMGHMPN